MRLSAAGPMARDPGCRRQWPNLAWNPHSEIPGVPERPPERAPDPLPPHPLPPPDFRLLARAINRPRTLYRCYLTAWVLLPDPSADGHGIVAPQYPEAISQVSKSVKQRSMTGIIQHRGAEGELWQPRFFHRTIRTVKEYHKKVEYIHLNPVRAGLVSRCPGFPPSRFSRW